ncbi:MAG: NADH-quinone oxidoreductase subunit C [Xanthomonadales bacterium]|uniref:NADH-quinone oxidoreductase subunit C n=1 Tax=Dokdonella sp. TaxID=2291710 RepID=UPI002C602E46|nr:NADH-quinone oxidoreductase subunit C [Xanthomonadales bacterium]HQV71506.1 NADH-quinone oxidoreductase subunit C [Dokdonella sp.]MBK7013338.1 NADH-quinone oxidoreductase subunit C [Xanthomonadales bacterium]MBK7211495.1 NADH-quinone oxidoreductase subunit C [Xanthomonadales bacterium]MBL0221338.1 NADH-quinone oxidoreductase subunit C [Xanthomonadales bacterium]
MSEPESLARRLQVQLGSKVSSSIEALGETTIEVLPENLLSVARTLRDDPAWQFEQCVDVCGVDYLSYGQVEWDTTDVTSEGFSRGVEGKGAGRFDWANRPRDTAMPRRFAVVAHLLSITHNHRLRLRTFCADDDVPSVPSLVGIWPAVNWFEREAFDLFGIVFEGHPDLRRILTDYGFVGHAFRKDFPLIGNVEVRYDADKKRVIYEPVSIEPRVLVPRTIRDDSRYEQARAESEGGSR